MIKFEEKLEQVNKVLDLPNKNWLFGAGISYEANIPLMFPLTRLVEKALEENTEMDYLESYYTEIKQLFNKPDQIHIEHILSHIGDLLELMERTDREKIKIGEYDYETHKLKELYKEIIKSITKIVRYGFCKDTKESGNPTDSKIKIEDHLLFVEALFKRMNNQEKRNTVNFFTTNYDTLLEDALVMERKKVIDGFEGSAMGFWSPKVFEERKNTDYPVYKLHGSIDWLRNNTNNVLYRTRYGTRYFDVGSTTMIYPQATKYIETQKDPFAKLFGNFRNQINSTLASYLSICGYSFGDNHINNEIDYALKFAGNNLTLVVFIKEDEELPERLNDIKNNSEINERVYILTEKGIHNNGVLSKRENNDPLDWWSFRGVIKLLEEAEDFK